MEKSWRCTSLFYFLSVLCVLRSGFDVCRAQESTASAPMLQSEKEALFTVLGSLVGSDWNMTQSYPDPCGSTPIQGSSCDQFKDF